MRSWLRTTAGGLPATYWYLWTGLLINRVGGFAVLFLSLYLTTQRGASPAAAGLIVGTYGIGGVIGTLAGGVLTDRWGRRRTLLWSHLACVAVLTGLALATDRRLIAALCALLGLTQSMPGPAFVAAITDVVPAGRRSRAFNLQFWAFNLGTAGASLVAGVLATWSYAGLFLIDAATTLTTVAVIAWKVPETLHPRAAAAGLEAAGGTELYPVGAAGLEPASAAGPEAVNAAELETGSATELCAVSTAELEATGRELEGSSATELYVAGGAGLEAAGTAELYAVGATRLEAVGAAAVSAGGGPSTRGLRTVLGDRIFLAFVGLTLLQALIYSQTNTIVPLAMRADGLGPSAYGAVVALGGTLIVLGQLFVPRLIDGHRKDRVLAVSMLAMAAGFALLSVAGQVATYLVAAAIWTVGSMLAAPPNAEINAELAPSPLRGRYQAVFFLSFPAASFLAPALGGVGLQYFGNIHWLIVAGVGVMAAGLHLVAGPRRERHAAGIRAETAPATT